MFCDKKTIATFFLLVGLIIIPGFSVSAASCGSDIPTITRQLENIALHPEMMTMGDQLLQDGDLNCATQSNTDRQNYLTARNNYLAARQLAINNLAYKPSTVAGTPGFYVTGVNSQRTEQERIDSNNSLIQEIDSILEDPTLTDEERQNLERERQSLVEANTNSQNAINGSTETQKGVIQDAQRKVAQESAACLTWTGGINVGNCTLQIFAWIGTIITGIFGSLLWVAGMALDISVAMSITSVNSWFSFSGVTDAWRLSRDIANLFFIFILLYIAIATIFDIPGLGDKAQKLVISVIVSALLINFSGFLTRIVVDATNIVAYEFYSKMSGGTGVATGTGVDRFNNIGWKFVQKLDLTQYFVEPKAQNPNEVTITRLSFISIIAQTFGNIILILCTAFLFLIATSIFLIRTLVLVFLYIISPIAIASRALPNGKLNYFKKWWDTLFYQALVAPGFIIPLYLVFYLLDSGIVKKIGTTTGSLVYGGGVWTIMVDAIILGLLILCLKVSQMLGAYGMEASTDLAGKATRLASRPISRYGGRFASRVGSGFNSIKIGEKTIGERTAESWNTGRLSRVRQSWDTDVLGDMRRSKTGQQAGEIIKSPLTSASKGFGQITGAMGVKRMDNVFGTESFNDYTSKRADQYLGEMKKREKPEDQARYLEGLSGFTKREEFAAVYSKLTTEQRRKLEGAASPTLKARFEEQRKNLRGKAGQDMAIEMVNNSKGADKAKAVEHLSQEDLNAVYKSLKPNERVELEKAAISTPLASKISDPVNGAKAKLNAKDIKETAREAAKDAREAASEAAATNIKNALLAGNTPNITDIRKITPNSIGDLSIPDVLSKPEVAPFLTVEQLKAIRNDYTVSDTDRDPIRTAIESFPITDPRHPEVKRSQDWLKTPDGRGF